MRLFSVHDKIVKFLEAAMCHWSTVLTANGVLLVKISIKCGTFLGDSLSTLLLIMTLALLSFILDKTSKGYHLSNSSTIVNHLVYMDELKLYSHSQQEIESLIHTVNFF